MNELQEYTASIPDSNPNKAELIRQWKIKNKWGQQEVKEVAVKLPFEKLKEDVGIVETVKTEGDAAGAGVEPAEVAAPVDLTDLVLEDGSSDLKPNKSQSSTESYNIDGEKVTAEEFNSYTDFYAEFNKNLDTQGALLPTVEDKSMISVNQNGKKTSYSAKQIRTLIENNSPGFEDISSVQEYVDRFGDNAEIVDQYKDTYKEQLDKYQQEIDVSKVEQDEINALLANPDLFKPYVVETEIVSGGGGSSMTGYMPSSTSIRSETIKPYENQLKEAKATLVKNRKTQNSSEPITQQEIEDQAKAIIEYQKQDVIRNYNAAKLLKDGKITETQQRRFLGIISDKAKDASWDLQPQADKVEAMTAKIKNGSTLQNIKSFSKSLEEDRLKLDALKSTMMKVSGGDMKMDPLDSTKRIDEFNKALTEYNSIVSNSNKKSGFLEKLGKEYQVKYNSLEAEQGNLIGMALDSDTSKYALDSLKRIYDKEEKLALNLALGTFNIAAQAGVLVEDAIKFSFGDSALLGTKDTDFKNKKLFGLAELGVKSQQAQEYIRNKYYKPVTFDNAFDSLSNFGEYTLEKAVEQAPIYAAIASGGLGMFAVSASSGGDYSSSRRIESQQIGGRAYNAGDVLFRSLGYAGSEYVFGALPTSRLFKSLNKGSGDASRREILDGMQQWWRNTKTYAPGNFGIAFVDKIGEGMTQVSQNLFDDSSQNIFRDVPEAVFVGGMFSYSAAAAPVIKGAVLANFSDFKTYDTYRANLKMINSLESSLTNPWTDADLKENTRKQIEQLKDQNLEIIEVQNRKVNNNLSREGFGYFQNGMERQEQLRVEAEAVLANESLSKEQKDKRIKELSNEFQALKNGINDYKQAFAKTFKLQTTKEQNRLKEEAKRRLQVQGKSAPSTQNVLDEAEKIHTEEKINNNLSKESTFLQSLVKAGVDIKYEVAQTNAEAIKIFTNLINARVDDANNSIDREQGDRYIEQFKEGINSGETNGVNIPSITNGKKVYDSVVSVQNSIANERSETGFHEIGHTIAAEALSTDPEAFKDVADSILEFLKQNNKDAYTRVKARSKGQGFDEVVTYFLEEVTSGNVNLEKQRDTGFIGALGQAFGIATSKAGKTDFDYNFKGETDVITFISQLGTKIKDGTLTVGDVKDIQASNTLTEGQDVDLDQADQDLFKESRVKLNELAVKFKEEKLDIKEDKQLRTEYKRLALSGPGLNFQGYKSRQAQEQGLKPINKSDAEGFVMQYYQGILDRYKPTIDGKDIAFSTFVISNINPKRALFFEQEIGGSEVETRISDERQKELENIEDTSSGPVAEVDTDVKLVDSIKIDKQPLSVEFKDKVRGFVTEQLKDLDPQSTTFRKQAFKPSKAFVDLIVKDVIGNPKKFREFLNDNPSFYKGLNISDLVSIDAGRVKKGQPRLFTEFNRRLTKQKDIEKFIMQGRVPYLAVEQMGQGADLFNRLKPLPAAVINNFFGSTPQNNSNRKRAIAKAIANKFIAEAAPSTEAFKAKPQIDRAKTAEKLQVSPNAKFSKTLLQQNNIEPGVVNDFLKATSSKEFTNILKEKLKDKNIKSPWLDTANDYFKENPIVGMTVGVRRKISKEISSMYSMVRKGEVAIKREVTNKGVDKAIDIINENLYKDLTLGYSYDTIDLIFGDKTNAPSQGTLEGINDARLGLKLLVDDLYSKGYTANEIKSFLDGAFVTPAGLGQYRGGTKASSIVLDEANLGIFKGGSRGSITRDVTDFNENFIEGLNKGDKVSISGDTYTKNYWTNPKSVYNRLSPVKQFDFLENLYNKGKENKKDLVDVIKSIQSLEVDDATKRWLTRGLFADMSALGKRSSTVRYVLTNSNGDILSFKQLEDLGLTRPGGDKGVFEHTKPANRVAVAAYAYVKTGDLRLLKELQNELANFDSALISELMDDSLRDLKLQSKMGADYKSTDSPMVTRYKEMISNLAEKGVFFYDFKTNKQVTPLEALSDGLVELETDDVQSIKEYKKEVAINAKFSKSRKQAAALDSGLIPDAIKYDRPISVQTAINALEKTDKALANGRKLDQPVRKIRVFDFDDTLARTKSNVLYTMPGESIVYNGSPKSFSELGERTGFIFLATEIKEAQEYANSNRGEVKPITVNNNKIATEENVIGIMEELGIATDEGLLYEMIDPRFEDFFIGKKNIDKVKESLKKNGYGGFKYEDGSQISSKGTESIAIIDKSIIKEPSKINAATFAKEAGNMEAEGAQWDFSEFSKVMQGSKGPLLDVAKIIADKRGTKDVFVLTARPANAAGPIKEFLASMGLDIPLANITGLGDGTPQAKAGWIMGKAAEGYNDFYFADDHTGNVRAVKDVLSQIDVKSKVQLAKFSKTQTFDTVVNDMIEDSSGIETYKKYSAARAKTVGASKGKYAFLIPPSAEDFTGLLYKMLGKGKKGDAQMAFLKTNLLDTYNRAESAVTQAKISAANDFKALKTKLKTLPKTLSKETGIGKFTYSHAVRVAAWTKQGMDIPGLSKRDIKELNDFVNKDAKLRVFTDELIKIQKGKEYPKPGKDWLGGNITTDIIGGINKVNRAEYQQEWRENIDIIFSEDNLNKMEAAYGTRWREAMVDSIRRMKSGSNRPIGGNRVTEGLLNWLNNSVGAVMFLNTRSALLQTISAVNFINLSDNNIVKAGVAFANQKQFWGDFMTLMNSDYLVERRNGLKINVSESEIADAVRESKNKPKAAIAFLLSKGFVMTRFADSFAIASGGSTFYRNRVNKYVKEGVEQSVAEKQAFADFKAIAETSQQSSSPSKISQQQASAAGRVILAWANTPMQYARIQKRAGQDLINGRGDWKTNVSKIVYYGAIQNLIFNTLQSAVFALGFGDDDEDDEIKAKKKEEKAYRVANGMIDSQLKGLGVAGAASVALKNTLMTLYEEYSKKGSRYENAVDDLLSFSPPLGSKIGKITGGLQSFSWNMKEMKEKGFSLDNPAYVAGAQVVTGLTNVPLDRVAKKINNVRGIVNEKSALWQKVALGLGWSTWDVDLGYYGGFDKEKPLTPKQQLKLEVDTMKKETSKEDQVKTLLDFGLTKKQIRELKNENNRVKKILELQKKDKK